MKILVISNSFGDFEYVNQQISNVDLDFVVMIGLNGIHYNTGQDAYIEKGKIRLPKDFQLPMKLGDSQLYRYLSSIKPLHFHVPIYVLPSYGDNGYLCDRLREKGDMVLNNFQVMDIGMKHSFNHKGDIVHFAGLGGKFSTTIHNHNKKKGHCIFGVDEISKLLSTNIKHLDMLFLNDVIGGMDQNGYSDFNYKCEINGREIDTFDLFEFVNADTIFLGGMPTEPDMINYNFAGGKIRTLVFCKNMKEMCYLYDTKNKWVSYV